MNPLQTYFNKYPTFAYDDTKASTSEFYRMCDFFDWDEDEKDDARGLFKDALVQEFNIIYGTDENNIESWNTLCRVLNVDPIPQGLDACREVCILQLFSFIKLVTYIKLQTDSKTYSCQPSRLG